MPDLSMHMGGCPGDAVSSSCTTDTSYDYAYIGGSQAGLIGTSAAAPEFAGWMAMLEQLTGSRFGNVNPDLFCFNGTPYLFRQNIPGNNGVITVTSPYTGYSGITGLG